MNKFLYILLTILFFTSCSQDEQPMAEQGYLSLTGLEVQAVETEVVTTRAVDEDFTIEVYKEGETTAITSLTYAAAQTTGSKIALEAGNYYLKVYNAAYGSSDYSKPVYFYQSEVFAIEADWVTYVDAVVPMINFGVRLVLPASFSEFFTSATLAVTVGDVTRSLGDGETAYFPVPATDGSTAISYTLTATNNDGEENQQTGAFGNNTPESSQVTAGKVYVVTYEYQ
ncbi:MAG: DUF4493 domain-containing protein [Bacteroides sp.]|nr:DUF4493 domain-containing protein [Bacteroides sp.]